MNSPQWYVVDRFGSAVPCRDRLEAEGIAARNMTKHPSIGPWRAVQMVEVEAHTAQAGVAAHIHGVAGPGPSMGPDTSTGTVADTEDPTDATARLDLWLAFQHASLHGTLDQALASPTIATCLRNIARASQPNATRPSRAHVWAGAGSPRGQTAPPISPSSPQVDLKRRASGDDD